MQALVERVERDERLDGIAEWLSQTFDRYVKQGPVKDVLAGTWFGHPIHPPLTAATVGAWSWAGLLDLFGGESSNAAADRLVGLGILAALPTAATGWNELADTDGGPKRVAALHGLGNATVLGLFVLSYLSRKAGRRGIGRSLSLLGSGLAGATAYLGGHLSFVRGIGVNQTAFERPKKRWIAVLDEDELKDGKIAVARADGIDLLVYRDGDRMYALSSRCSHRGAPLQRGRITTSAGCTAIVCPWHGSTFCLEDGRIVRGPATAPQPAYEVRAHEGKIEVRPRQV
jgi:nitrite reductase/ring-hydroxylating ferredoxin subunit